MRTRVELTSLALSIAIVAAAAVASATTLPTPAPSPQVVPDDCADADGNHLLSVTDGVVALRAAAELPSSCDVYHCDVDGSGAVTVTDGVGILQRAAGLRFTEWYGCPVRTRTRDFSDFTTFRLERRPALGFCPGLGSVLGVEIARQENGTYLLTLAVASERPSGDPDCVLPFQFDGEDCIAPDPQPGRPLTADELARLRAAFATVETDRARPPECAIIAFDPCIINAFSWDDDRLDDYYCSGPRIQSGAATTLIEILNELIVPAP